MQAWKGRVNDKRMIIPLELERLMEIPFKLNAFTNMSALYALSRCLMYCTSLAVKGWINKSHLSHDAQLLAVR